MISDKFNIDEFYKAIEGKSGKEAICAANREVTEVERWLIKHRNDSNDVACQGDMYSTTLKQFIVFMRSSIGMPRTGAPVSMLYANFMRHGRREH
jgi:hypothetical protein